MQNMISKQQYTTETKKYFFGAFSRTVQTPKLSKKDTQIITQLVGEFKDITRAEIKKWRDALQMAGHPEEPRWVSLQDLYDNLESDGHYQSVRVIRTASVLAKRFYIADADGQENIEKTNLLDKKWFFDMLRHLLESIYKGYTVLELQDPNTMEWELIPRRNIDPKYKRVYLEATGSKYINYNDPAMAGYVIAMRNHQAFGLLNDIVPQLIWKRNAQQTWADFSERFGIPLVTAETVKTDEKDIAKIDELLSQLGQAATAVLPEGTKITIHDASTKGDPYKIFQEQINTTNDEISKRVVGGTMLNSNGSSLSQSEVHERNLDDKIAYEDRNEIRFMVNDYVLPMLRMHGFAFDEGDKFVFDDSQDVDLDKFWTIINEANNWYEIPEDWVSRKFKFPITALKKQPATRPNTKAGVTANFH